MKDLHSTGFVKIYERAAIRQAAAVTMLGARFHAA